MVSVTAKSRTITNETANDGSVVEAEMVELYNNDSTLATAVTTLESGNTTITGNKTYSGTATFNAAFALASTFSMTGATAHLLLASGTASTSVTDAGIYVSSDVAPPGIRFLYGTGWQFSNNGADFNTLGTTTWPIGFRGSAKPVYASANTLTIAFIRERDSTDVVNMSRTTSLTVDITTSGAGGLDNGAESSNQWYYLYAVSKSDGTTSAVLSTVNESASGSITLPATYVYKRQLNFALRNNGSSNFIPWTVWEGWPHYPVIQYDVSVGYYSAAFSVGTNNVLNNGTATSFTAVACSSFVPPIAKQAIVEWAIANGAVFAMGPAGASLNQVTMGGDTSGSDSGRDRVSTDTSQQIEYKRIVGSTGVSLGIVAFMPEVV